ncbi:ABC transporter ATP-binding protein [Angustibacter aerolatus]
MAMAVPTQKALRFGPSARRLVERLRPERTTFVLVVLLAVASVGLSVVGPRLLGRATDLVFAGVVGSRLPAGQTTAEAVRALRARGQGTLADVVQRAGVVPGRAIDFGAVGRVLLLALVLYVVASLCMLVQGRLLNLAVQRTVQRLRSDVEDQLHELPLPYFDGRPRGEILSRVTNDIDNVAQSLQQTLSQLLTALLTVVGVVAMMLVVSPLLSLVALLTIPASLLLTRAVARRAQGRFVAQWAATGRLNGQVEEAFSGHTLVNVYGRRAEVEREFARTNQELHDAAFGAQLVSGLIMPTMLLVGNLGYVAVAVVGGLRITSGTMTLGDVQAFVQYSRQFTQPLTQVASMANLLQSGVASAERVFELLDAERQSPDPEPAATVEHLRGRVAFEHVRFGYDERPLLRDLSLVAEPGQTVAVVGPTGAGKTTLVNLLMRFHELQGGRITLDGVDVATMRRDDLRSRVGMVLQDAWVFDGSIRDNIAYGRPSATEAEVLRAAEAAYVDRFVHGLPDGYDTLVGTDGGDLSAGERQLITIARAFLADPALLVLDEATSSVDTRTEVLVQEAMAALRSDRTSFVIAHRLSTIRDADLILVMDAGEIVEQGTHAELLAAGGRYRELYDAQFAAPTTDPTGLDEPGPAATGAVRHSSGGS